MRSWIKPVLVALLSVASTACVSAENQNTEAGDDGWVSLSRTGGVGLYLEKCGMCHQEDGMGTGLLGRRYEGDQALLENREDLTETLVVTVVRNGVGNMLPMARGEVSDEQLELIAAYLAGGE